MVKDFCSTQGSKFIVSTDSVVHCIRYANIKIFLSHISLYMDRVQTYTEIYTYQRKPIYLHILPNVTYFTH